jgi:hypothetical protein
VTVPLLARETRWECPNCTLTDVTNDPRPHSRMHSCRGLRGLTTPMVEAGTRCKVEARDREDFTNGDEVVTDGEGRAVMSIVTTRDDGQDCAVFAPCATITKENNHA